MCSSNAPETPKMETTVQGSPQIAFLPAFSLSIWPQGSLASCLHPMQPNGHSALGDATLCSIPGA